MQALTQAILDSMTTAEVWGQLRETDDELETVVSLLNVAHNDDPETVKLETQRNLLEATALVFRMELLGRQRPYAQMRVA